ncbi:hypothetical protein IV203_033602 [Nitzschia inconspicua]|uniref:Transposase n=1 Tax=Nitzschia inconspicua TaxID=303405 RepID=A0A9K3M252_9STRA|nr:hypothetical protein IV203_033602 [Nitzschia inconspicua]
MPPDPFTGIPADIQAFRDGWTEITDHGHPYEVVLARDFSNDYLAERICGTFRNMGDKVTSSLVSLGKEVSRASILELLLGDVAIVRLEQFTTEMLVKRNFPPLVPYEYREFLYTRWYRSRFNLSNDRSFSHFMPPLSRSLDIIIMDPHRFATIQSCTRGFSQAGRTGSEDSDVWMEAGAMLRKLNELEVAIFSRSASNLLNHGNGSIVVDDELIASRASDVEQKVVSNRKVGKEGPVADCIACALSSVLLGMRLRVKNDPENVEQLLHTLPLSTASGNDLEVAFDRGYGKLSSVEAIASRNLHVVTVAGTLGSRHPFNTPDEWISTLNKWKTKRGVDQQKILSWTLLCENWNLRGDPMLGEEVRIAERTKVVEKPIYAIALREVFDRKNPVKYLKFFASKNHRPYTFVAVERNEHLDQNVLFSPKTPSPERSSVEQALLQSAQPLTVGQRTVRSGSLIHYGGMHSIMVWAPQKQMIPGTSTIKSKEIANNSTYMCPKCMVVLCKKTVGNSGAKSCHTLWHERHNLEAEGSKCRKRLRVAREMNDDEAQKRKLHATNASIKRHSPAKTSQQIQRSQTQVAINDPQDPQDSFDAVENVVEHVLENLMEMEHGEEHGDEEKEEDEHDFLDMEEYSDGSDE